MKMNWKIIQLASVNHEINLIKKWMKYERNSNETCMKRDGNLNEKGLELK